MKYRSIFDRVIKSFVQLILTPLIIIFPKKQAQIIERILFHLNERTYNQHFFSLVNRPKFKFVEGYQPINIDHITFPSTILLQGPVITDNDFTISTVTLYRLMFPESKIIVSTWSDESDLDISKLKKLGADIVISNKPNISGYLNYNYQQKSTLEGLRKAKEEGAKFILKTRSDQRINNRYAISLLYALIKKFPPKEGLTCKYRIFFISLFSLSNIPFHLSDMFQFGHIDDLIGLWTNPDHKIDADRNLVETFYERDLTIEQFINNDPTLPEVWIGRHYAERFYGNDCLKHPSEIFHKLLKDVVGIVDKSQLDLFWPKYKAYEEHRDYRIPRNSQHLSFSKWIAIEEGITNDVVNYDPYSKF